MKPSPLLLTLLSIPTLTTAITVDFFIDRECDIFKSSLTVSSTFGCTALKQPIYGAVLKDKLKGSCFGLYSDPTCSSPQEIFLSLIHI